MGVVWAGKGRRRDGWGLLVLDDVTGEFHDLALWFVFQYREL